MIHAYEPENVIMNNDSMYICARNMFVKIRVGLNHLRFPFSLCASESRRFVDGKVINWCVWIVCALGTLPHTCGCILTSTCEYMRFVLTHANPNVPTVTSHKVNDNMCSHIKHEQWISILGYGKLSTYSYSQLYFLYVTTAMHAIKPQTQKRPHTQTHVRK